MSVLTDGTNVFTGCTSVLTDYTSIPTDCKSTLAVCTSIVTAFKTVRTACTRLRNVYTDATINCTLGGAEFFEDVVHPGHRQIPVRFLLTLPLRVQLVPQFPNPNRRLLIIGGQETPVSVAADT